jgi:four helix bundle protein
MKPTPLHSGPRPFDIHERLLIFACDIVATTQFLHTRGPVACALSYQLLAAGMSTGANAAEADGASSGADFVAKLRISLKEAKETRFRLRVCRRCNLLDASFDPVVNEAEELIRILSPIIKRSSRPPK